MKAEYAFGPFTLTAQWSSHDLQTEFTWSQGYHHHLCTTFPLDLKALSSLHSWLQSVQKEKDNSKVECFFCKTPDHYSLVKSLFSPIPPIQIQAVFLDCFNCVVRSL